MKNYLSKNSGFISFFALILIFVSISITQGQVVNGYAKVTNISGNTITISSAVGEINETADTFDNNDYIIIMQMQDDVIGITADNSNFGNVGSIASAGLYEVRRIVSQTAGPPRVLTLDAPPTNTYNIGPNSSVQIITFRRFGSPNYTSTSNMSALPWNGNIGGVLAIDVQGVFTLAHNLSADGAGFRGAANDDNSQSGWSPMPNPLCEDNIFRTSYPGTRALKGEGIYKNTNANYVAARAKMLNGGGGGNSHNGGGGGGGNYSAGGLGGWGWNCDVVNRNAGGQGGLGLNAYISANRIFMGGGGGAGERNNEFDSYGGNGGGIILLRANTLQTTGACGTLTISANGANAAPGNGWDGCGGGGAGGSIVLQVNNWNIAGTCPILVSSNGGNGGSVNSSTHGGGGGGGQGAVFYSISIPTINTTTQTNFGIGGCNNNSSPCDDQAQNGGGPNGAGIFGGVSTPLPVELVYFRAKKIETKALISWAIQNADIENFDVEKSVGSTDAFEPFQKVFAKRNGGIQNYEVWDNNLSTKHITYYRLKIYYNNGETDYSKIVSLSGESVKGNLQIYPNPFKNQFFVVGSEIQKISLTDLSGKVVFEKLCNSTDKEEIQLEKLVQGAYIIVVQTSNEIFREKMIHLP